MNVDPNQAKMIFLEAVEKHDPADAHSVGNSGADVFGRDTALACSPLAQTVDRRVGAAVGR
jgi:hypothetical protein